MKNQKLIAVFLTLVMVSSLFAGCGKAMDVQMEAPKENYASDAIYDSVTSDSAMSEMQETLDAEGTNKIQTDAQRKLIRRISINAETSNLDSLLSAIDEKVALLGGYAESRNVYSGSLYSNRPSRRYANLTLRIPKDRLDEFVNHVQATSNVISSNETSDDVTLSYVATQSRMTALQKEEARLLELIDKAANLTELLELEKRLTEIRADLETVTSQLLLYDNLVDYGTVTLSISEVEVLTLTQEPSFWGRITGGFMNSLRNLWSFLKEAAVFLVESIPYLVPIGAVTMAVILLLRRRKNKKQPPSKAE